MIDVCGLVVVVACDYNMGDYFHVMVVVVCRLGFDRKHTDIHVKMSTL